MNQTLVTINLPFYHNKNKIFLLPRWSHNPSVAGLLLVTITESLTSFCWRKKLFTSTYYWTVQHYDDIMKERSRYFYHKASYVSLERIMTHQDICMAWPTAGSRSCISSGQACTKHWSWRSDCSPRYWWCLSQGKPSYSIPGSPLCLSCRWPSCRCPTPTCRSWRGTCCGTVC